MALYDTVNKEYCAIVACRHMDSVPKVNAGARDPSFSQALPRESPCKEPSPSLLFFFHPALSLSLSLF